MALDETSAALTELIALTESKQREAFDSADPESSRAWIYRKDAFRLARTAIASMISDELLHERALRKEVTQ